MLNTKFLVILTVSVILAVIVLDGWLRYSKRQQAKRDQEIADRKARIKALASRDAMYEATKASGKAAEEFTDAYHRRPIGTAQLARELLRQNPSWTAGMALAAAKDQLTKGKS